MVFKSSRLMKARSAKVAVSVSPSGICSAARAIAGVVLVPLTRRSRSSIVSQVVAIPAPFDHKLTRCSPPGREVTFIPPPSGGCRVGAMVIIMNLEVIHMLEAMTRNWGAIALRGFIAVLLGAVAIVWPGPTVGVLVILLGAFALVEGVANIVAGVRGREGWAIGEGVISVAVGLVIVVWPAITALALLYVIAAGAIITGIVRIVAAIQLRRVLRNEWLLAGSGLASVIFGVIAAVFPGAGILALIWLLGAWLVVLGIILIAFAVSLRQLAHSPNRARVA